MQFIQKHLNWKIMSTKRKVATVTGTLILICIISMAFSGTLSYPYIMADRQIDLIHYCRSGLNTFEATEFGFKVSAPEGYCLIPDRTYPENAYLQALPRGWYSVLSEYIVGSVVKASRATVYLEHTTPERATHIILETLGKGGFLAESTQSEKDLAEGLHAHIILNAKGVEDGTYFDWAFIDSADQKSFMMLLLPHTNGDSTIFDYILEHITSTH